MTTPYPFVMTTTGSLERRLSELEREIEVLVGERERVVLEIQKRLSVGGVSGVRDGGTTEEVQGE